MDTVPEKLSVLISKVSKNYFLDGSFELIDSPYVIPDKAVHRHFVSNILICNPQIRMIYKVHYGYEKSFEILKDSLSSGITNEKIDDYYREVCNLIAGRVKLIFQEHDFSLGISIPLKNDGFDELYFPVRIDNLSGEYFWNLKKDHNDILMSLYVEILQPDALDSIDLSEIDVVSGDQDEMEFF